MWWWLNTFLFPHNSSWFLYFLLLKNIYYIWKSARVLEVGMGRSFIHQSTPQTATVAGLGQAKPGSGNFIWASHAGQAPDTAVKLLLVMSTFSPRVPCSVMLIFFQSSFLPTCILGGSQWWLMAVGPCHPHRKPGLTSKLLASTWSSLDCCGHF